jgi:Tfp pilus assembly pilus retraction ATPase PilT
MQSGSATGMLLMDMAIQALFDAKQISGAEAYKKAINKSKFEQYKEAS